MRPRLGGRWSGPLRLAERLFRAALVENEALGQGYVRGPPG